MNNITSASSRKNQIGSRVASHPAVCFLSLQGTSPIQPLWGFSLLQLAGTNSHCPPPFVGPLSNTDTHIPELLSIFLSAFPTSLHLCPKVFWLKCLILSVIWDREPKSLVKVVQLLLYQHGKFNVGFYLISHHSKWITDSKYTQITIKTHLRSCINLKLWQLTIYRKTFSVYSVWRETIYMW